MSKIDEIVQKGFYNKPLFWFGFVAYWLGGAIMFFLFFRKEWTPILFVPFVFWMIF